MHSCPPCFNIDIYIYIYRCVIYDQKQKDLYNATEISQKYSHIISSHDDAYTTAYQRHKNSNIQAWRLFTDTFRFLSSRKTQGVAEVIGRIQKWPGGAPPAALLYCLRGQRPEAPYFPEKQLFFTPVLKTHYMYMIPYLMYIWTGPQSFYT